MRAKSPGDSLQEASSEPLLFGVRGLVPALWRRLVAVTLAAINSMYRMLNASWLADESASGKAATSRRTPSILPVSGLRVPMRAKKSVEAFHEFKSRRSSSLPAAGILMLYLCLFSLSETRAQEFRAFWADAFGAGFKNASEVTNFINNVRAAKANAIVPEIRKRGDAYYNGSIYEPKPTDISPSTFDPLQEMITQGHDTSGGKQRIEVHGWIVSYKIWGSQSSQPPASTPPHPYNAHQDWLTQDINGAQWDGTSYSFDPGHPEVQQYTFNVCMDIISRYEIDGLNFDYIRYTGNTWGYHPVTVARFNSRYGTTGQPSPTDPLWLQFRRDQVTALVRKVYLNTIATKPWVKISADTITWGNNGVANDTQWYDSAAAWKDVLQDWRGWMEEGILDLNIPMDYYRHHNTTSPDHATAYTNWMNFAKDHRFNRHVAIGPGIYLNYTSNAIIQMRATRAPSPLGNYADGMCAYVYKQPDNQGTTFSTFKNYLTNSPNAYDSISPAIFAEPASPPIMPWKVSPTTGHLKGCVYGLSETNALDGATITVNGPSERTLFSDATGFYGAVDLPPGEYTLMASFGGYDPYTTNFTVTVGIVTTRDITLSAPATPLIVMQPQDRTVALGSDVTFNVTATGSEPLTYQWRFEDTDILGATASSYTRQNVQSDDAGNYSVVVSNDLGTATSSNAALTVTLPPAITMQPQGQTVPAGANVAFSVAAEGFSPITYQWRFEGTNIPGATNATLVLIYVQLSNAGDYSVEVSNPGGSVPSSTVTLTVYPPAPAQFQAMGWSGGQFGFTLTGESGLTYLLEASANLVDWLPLTIIPSGEGPVQFIDPDAVNYDHRFYRARSVPVRMMTDFESYPLGTQAMFRQPSLSGPTSSYIDSSPGVANFARVENAFPPGQSSAQVMHVAWTFKPGISSNTWLRLTTFNAPQVPNPTVSFQQAVRFDIFADRDLYLALGLRETSTTAPLGGDGGSSGPIEWIGGKTDNTSHPPKGRLIPAGQWTTVQFFIPFEPIKAYTGNAILESATGKGVLEQLAIAPASDSFEAYNLYLDNFQLVDLYP